MPQTKSVQQYFADLLSAAGYDVMMADDLGEALHLCELYDRATRWQTPTPHNYSETSPSSADLDKNR